MPLPIHEPPIHETIAYYDVDGGTEPEIVAALNAKGPAASGGAYWGVAHWTASWDFKTRATADGRCEVHDAGVRLDVLIVLPRWTNAALASPTVVEKWKRLESALVAHEREHEAHGRDAIRAAATILDDAVHDGRCEDVRQHVEDAAQAEIRRGFELDKALDERTGHGATEGVAIQW